MKDSNRRRPALPPRSAFAGFRFPPDVIVVAVRLHLRYNLSYRDVEELLIERGAWSTVPKRDPAGDGRWTASDRLWISVLLKTHQGGAAEAIRSRWPGLRQAGGRVPARCCPAVAPPRRLRRPVLQRSRCTHLVVSPVDKKPMAVRLILLEIGRANMCRRDQSSRLATARPDR
ncbi:hypothetical protein GCM10027610_080960 [Dactylosporangium cerinum]